MKKIIRFEFNLHFRWPFSYILSWPFTDCSLDAFDQWIKVVQRLNNKHLNSFLNGLNRDKDAIQNALIFPELSNGLAEGKINKGKKIKRMMFGRCHFQTLKMKVLLSEK